MIKFLKINENFTLFDRFENMIKCNMIKILKTLKYDKMQYDKLSGPFYHKAF